MPELTLHVAPASAPCRAVLLHHRLMGQLAPELEVQPVDLGKEEHKTPEFLRHNPLHTVPTLVTPWGPVWESRAIMRLFEALSPEPVAYPVASFHRAIVDRLLDWDLGTLYRAVSSIVYPKAFRGEEPSADNLDTLNNAMRFLDQKQLGDGRAFLTGNAPTIADISSHMTLSLLRLIGLEVDDIPRVAEWQGRMAELPGHAEIDVPFAGWIASMQEGTEEPQAEEAVSAEPEPEPEPPAKDAEPTEAEPAADAETSEPKPDNAA